MRAQLLHTLPYSAKEKQIQEAEISVRAPSSAPLALRWHKCICCHLNQDFLTPLSRADAYRSRRLACKASVSLRCALCRSRFRLRPSQLQQHESSAEAAPPNSLHNSDGSLGGSSSDSSRPCLHGHALSVSPDAHGAATAWKQWDLCWAKVGGWPYWYNMTFLCCHDILVSDAKPAHYLFVFDLTSTMQACRSIFGSPWLSHLRCFL